MSKFEQLLDEEILKFEDVADFNLRVEVHETIMAAHNADMASKLEGLLSNLQYLGDPILDPFKKHIYPYILVGDVYSLIDSLKESSVKGDENERSN